MTADRKSRTAEVGAPPSDTGTVLACGNGTGRTNLDTLDAITNHYKNFRLPKTHISFPSLD